MTELQTDPLSHARRPNGTAAPHEEVVQHVARILAGLSRPSIPCSAQRHSATRAAEGAGGCRSIARVGFGYVPNRWTATLIDPRAIELDVRGQKVPRRIPMMRTIWNTKGITMTKIAFIGAGSFGFTRHWCATS